MKRDTKIVAWFTGAIPVVILGASLLCSWAIAQGASPKWRLPFRILCHGLPQRSLEAWGETMPICARCSGIYAGLLAGIMIFALMPWINERLMKIVLLLSVVPMGIDGVTQTMGLRESMNPLRIATGLAAGLAFGIWALSAVERGGERAFHPS